MVKRGMVETRSEAVRLIEERRQQRDDEGEALAGENPATVREAVERAKLVAIDRTAGVDCYVDEEDIIVAADVLKKEAAMFQPHTMRDHIKMRETLRDAFQASADGAGRIGNQQDL